MVRRYVLPLLLLAALDARGAELLVSGAASTRDALAEVAHVYEVQTGDRVLLNFGGSNELVRQIKAGAKVDVILSADDASLAALHVVERKDVVANHLAIVTAKPIRQLADLAAMRRIAIGNPASVPAGIYAKQYLEAQHLWMRIAPALIPTSDVRAALAAFDAGAVDAAIVYRTDAMLAKRAHATFVVSADTPRIVYPAAILRDSPAARRFFTFLTSAAAKAIFVKWGFIPR